MRTSGGSTAKNGEVEMAATARSSALSGVSGRRLVRVSGRGSGTHGAGMALPGATLCRSFFKPVSHFRFA